MKPKIWLALRVVALICSLNESLSSIHTPRSRSKLTLFKIVSPIVLLVLWFFPIGFMCKCHYGAFLTFKSSRFFLHHSCSWLISSWNMQQSPPVTIFRINFKSSANPTHVDNIVRRSFINIVKKNGPRIEPCGIPDVGVIHIV